MNAIYRLFIILAAASVLASCSQKTPDTGESLSIAREALASGDYSHAQTICDNLSAEITADDTTAINATQAADLAMLFMALSDHRNEDENVAVATLCMQYAFDHSADSLRSFAASLPLEEQRHFELLRRISISIDNPVDLMGEEFLEDETQMHEMPGEDSTKH